MTRDFAAFWDWRKGRGWSSRSSARYQCRASSTPRSRRRCRLLIEWSHQLPLGPIHDAANNGVVDQQPGDDNSVRHGQERPAGCEQWIVHPGGRKQAVVTSAAAVGRTYQIVVDLVTQPGTAIPVSLLGALDILGWRHPHGRIGYVTRPVAPSTNADRPGLVASGPFPHGLISGGGDNDQTLRGKGTGHGLANGGSPAFGPGPGVEAVPIDTSADHGQPCNCAADLPR